MLSTLLQGWAVYGNPIAANRVEVSPEPVFGMSNWSSNSNFLAWDTMSCFTDLTICWMYCAYMIIDRTWHITVWETKTALKAVTLLMNTSETEAADDETSRTVSQFSFGPSPLIQAASAHIQVQAHRRACLLMTTLVDNNNLIKIWNVPALN